MATDPKDTKRNNGRNDARAALRLLDALDLRSIEDGPTAMAALGATMALHRVIADALDGDPGARQRLEDMSKAAEGTGSEYQNLEQLCRDYLHGKPLLGIPLLGPAEGLAQFMFAFSWRVGLDVGDMSAEDVIEASQEAADGRDLAVRLLVKTKAKIKRDGRGVPVESEKNYEKRMRKQLSQAKFNARNRRG